MPDDPIALRIMRAVVDRLETISIAGGFHTAAGSDVSVGWLHQDPPNLSLAVYGSVETGSQDRNRSRVNAVMNMIVTARVPVPVADTSAELVEKVAADVQSAVEDEDDRTLGGLVQGDIVYQGRETIPPPPGSRVAWTYLKYRVGYFRKYGNPASRG